MERPAITPMHSPTQPSGHRTDFQATDAGSTLAMFDHTHDEAVPSTVRSSLSPSLLQDLLRFSKQGGDIDLLHAVAASVRHGKAKSLCLEKADQPIVASISPRLQIYRAPRDLCALPPSQLAVLRLSRVEPESASVPPGSTARIHVGPLRPLLWSLALFGPRDELLPEIAGAVRYRLAFGVTLAGLPIDSEWMPTLHRLRSMPLSLEDMASGGSFRRVTPQRMLNAIYLQSGLMISRAFDARVW
jgi:hypothetical protein